MKNDLESAMTSGDFNIIKRQMSDGNSLEMLVKLNAASPYLVVFGQDAIVRSRHSLPRFFRWSWAKEESYSAIFLNDPTLYLNDTIEGGWFQGTSKVDYMKEAFVFISDIVRTLNIEMNNVLFFGASAGGFTSLCMGALARANVLVDIPQTNLLTYHIEKAKQSLLQTCYGIHDSYDQFRPRLDAISFMHENASWPKRLWFIQNIYDSRHLRGQTSPFITELFDALSSDPRPFDFKLFTTARFSKRRGGHIPAEEYYVRKMIGSILKISYDEPLLIDIDESTS